MKSVKSLATFLLLIGSLFAMATVFAQGYHHYHNHGFHSSVIIGGPIFWPGPVYPPLVVGPPSQVVYVEQGAPQAGENPGDPQWWYYCANTQTYYPYVKQCASPWQRVTPQPPNG